MSLFEGSVVQQSIAIYSTGAACEPLLCFDIVVVMVMMICVYEAAPFSLNVFI